MVVRRGTPLDVRVVPPKPGRHVRPCGVCGDDHVTPVSFIVEELGLLSGRRVDEKDLRRPYQARGLPFSGPRTMLSLRSRLTRSFRKHRYLTSFDRRGGDGDGRAAWS